MPLNTVYLYYREERKTSLIEETKPTENWRDETPLNGLFDIASREDFSPGFYAASGGEPMETN